MRTLIHQTWILFLILKYSVIIIQILEEIQILYDIHGESMTSMKGWDLNPFLVFTGLY
jgi:hypothetical protein